MATAKTDTPKRKQKAPGPRPLFIMFEMGTDDNGNPDVVRDNNGKPVVARVPEGFSFQSGKTSAPAVGQPAITRSSDIALALQDEDKSLGLVRVIAK